jgi:hypothetical protein
VGTKNPHREKSTKQKAGEVKHGFGSEGPIHLPGQNIQMAWLCGTNAVNVTTGEKFQNLCGVVSN